jgi:hypothetical protein
MLSKDQIREIFLKNGFTIKEGQTDLKPYVYTAAYELMSAVIDDIISNQLINSKQ